MKTTDFIREHTACREGADWALSISDDMSAVWDALVDQGKHEWLLWTATRPGAFSDTVLRKLACRFVRETPLVDGRTVWDLLTDKRSHKAIEVAERYADGKATEAELSAAYSDAYAAVADAYAAAACAAAYAERAAYFAARAAADVAYSAAYAANATVCAAGATDAARVAYAAAADAAESVCDAAYAAVRAVSEAAKSAQVKMIAELGNPFKKGTIK